MRAIKREFKAGDIIFSEGSLGSTFYYLEKGRVEVSRRIGGKKEILSVLTSGETFGEYALLGRKNMKRSATVTVLENSDIIVINKDILDSQLENVPQFLGSLLKKLIEKVIELEERCLKAENHGR